jgi:GTP-binding protein
VEPLKPLEVVNGELSRHSAALAARRQIVVLNKIDLPEGRERAALFRKALGECELLEISAATGQGTRALVARMLTLIETCGEDPAHGQADPTHHDPFDTGTPPPLP